MITDYIVDKIKTRTKMRSRRKRGFACMLPVLPTEPNPAHPLIIGVIKWMKARTEAVLADPTIPWNGVWQDYHWLKECKNLEPNPRQYITPDNPNRLEPGLFDRLHLEYTTGGFSLRNLEGELNMIDSLAWFDMEVAKKVTPTKEQYAKLTLKGLAETLDEFAREEISV